MHWNKTQGIGTQEQAFSSGWAIVGIMGVLTGLALADWPGSRSTIPQNISRMDIVLQEPNDSAAAEPNTTIPAVEPPNPKIMGEVFVMGKPVPGVLITTDNGGGVCVTDSNGYFTVEVPYGWSGKLTPAQKGWVVDPPCRTYQTVCRDVNERCDHPVCFKEGHVQVRKLGDPLDDDKPSPPAIASVPAQGRLGVSPMVISRKARPGQRVNASLSLQNMGIHAPKIAVAVADLTQLSTGAWMPTEPSVDSASAHAFSCVPWLELDPKVQLPLSLAALKTATLPFAIQVPAHAHGFYSAALVVQPVGTVETGNAVDCSLVIPVLVNVEQDKARTEVAITDIDLVVPFTPHASPRVRLTVENQGPTMCRFATSITATTSTSKTDETMTINKKWIMPGARLVLETDYIGPFPDQPLILRGQLALINEQFFTKHIPLTSESSKTGENIPSHDTLTECPTRTLAMLDYHALKTLGVHQCPDASDPFRTYVAQYHLGVAANFNASVHATAHPCSPAQGNWSATVSPSTLNQLTYVLIDVKGTDVAIEKLPAGSKAVVAKLAVQIIPEIDDWCRTSPRD